MRTLNVSTQVSSQQHIRLRDTVLIPSSDSDTLQVNADFLDDVLSGLRREQKELPSKYFYDEKGSRLFDQITETAEYYPTRTEEALMRQHGTEMVESIGPKTLLVELGSGSSAKTQILLRKLSAVAAYIPIDISAAYLETVAVNLRKQHPGITIVPLAADYTQVLTLPTAGIEYDRIVVYFPGSTIGNFTPLEAAAFLSDVRTLIGSDGGLLIGVDLVKDTQVLEAAYNDAAGITAQFNLNLLSRINIELGADFDVASFRHRAVFNETEHRIEMHLVSSTSQTVHIGDDCFLFEAGESIYTESSYKYTVESFTNLVSRAGFTWVQTWKDNQAYFSVHFLEAS